MTKSISDDHRAYIEGYFVYRMTKAWENFGSLKTTVEDLQWRLCLRSDLYDSHLATVDEARRHCRDLLKGLDHIASTFRSVERPHPYQQRKTSRQKKRRSIKVHTQQKDHDHVGDHAPA
jgi:hypothetical protein